MPVGGNSLFVANVDYRLRDPFLPDLLQYTLFVDVGSVWNRHTQSDFGGAKLYWTPGLGLRVFTPVGPIQINAGYNGYGTEKGQALFTPPRDLAEKGFTGVYCAVPVGTPPSEAPLARLDANTKQWKQTGTCPLTFQPPARNSLLRRLTFTFSIGPEF